MIIKGNSVGYPLPDLQKGMDMQGDINMNGNSLSGIKTPETADDAANKGYVDEGIAGAKKYADDKHFELTVTISVSYWAQHASGAYYAIVDKLNVRGTDKVDVDVLIVNNENLDAMVALEEAWCNVIKVTVPDGYIVLYSKEKLEVDLPIKLKVVR